MKKPFKIIGLFFQWLLYFFLTTQERRNYQEILYYQAKLGRVNPYVKREYLTWNEYWDKNLKPRKEIFYLKEGE